VNIHPPCASSFCHFSFSINPARDHKAVIEASCLCCCLLPCKLAARQTKSVCLAGCILSLVSLNRITRKKKEQTSDLLHARYRNVFMVA
jgi:hypothetical protein